MQHFHYFSFSPLSYAAAFKTTLWGAQSSILGAVFDFTLGQSEAEGKGNSGTVYYRREQAGRRRGPEGVRAGAARFPSGQKGSAGEVSTLVCSDPALSGSRFSFVFLLQEGVMVRGGRAELNGKSRH